ncbi:DUF4956 domain-containing protein [Olsenella intestinalis]|uniref:DUF4956 domain-containing protein n=1 Tax=Olsenella intestinalis TaxID=2930083 RepID=UPI00201042E6|nr:DUF4956 domain-containing protein [Olsenella intestinalis]
MFESVFGVTDTATTSTVSLVPFLASVGVALALGLALALIYCFRSRHTRSFVITMVTLPAIVAVVITMINGNIGAGIAVAGSFSLVRFRSVPGQARDIAFVFLAMCVGLVCGMGYLGIAGIVTALIGGVNLLLQATGFGRAGATVDRTLRITVPEDLDHTHLFDDLFDRFTTYHELRSVKTTNMGSLYKLIYNVGLSDPDQERAFIDELRCRNGNLEIALSHQEVASDEI